MASSNPQRFNDEEGTLRLAIAGVLAGVWTALPAEVVSYDADAETVAVQPLLQGQITAPDGTVSSINLPVVNDVPVQFPGSGGFRLTFPINPGDECLLVFASRGIDAWHQLGGIQAPVAGRAHAMSDAFAILGFRSIPKTLTPPASTTAVQLRSDDGTSLVEIQPGGAIRAVAPAGMTVVGNFHCTGTATADVDVVSGPISLKNHKTSLVQPGTGTSGVPVP